MPSRKLGISLSRHPFLDLDSISDANNDKRNDINKVTDVSDAHLYSYNGVDVHNALLKKGRQGVSGEAVILHDVFTYMDESRVGISATADSSSADERPANQTVSDDFNHSAKCYVRSDSQSAGGLTESQDSERMQVVDKDHCAWRERVKRSVSFSSLPNKFRPLRHSFDSYSRNELAQYAALNVPERTCFRSNDFYMRGERPEYLINPNTSVTRHPSQLINSSYCNYPKLSSVLRKRSLQEQTNKRKAEVYNSKRDTSLVAGNKLSEQRSSREESALQVCSRSTEFPREENIVGTVFCRSQSLEDIYYFNILKETTARLQLPIRIASTLVWKARYADNASGCKPQLTKTDDELDHGLLTKEKKKDINKTLNWLRRELLAMHGQDEKLAEQFLSIRRSMNALRWKRQCHSHQQLIEEAEDDIEELRYWPRVVDTPLDIFSSATFLRQFGVTRMNIASRRFSTC